MTNLSPKHFNEIANEWDQPEKVKTMQGLALKVKKVLNFADNPSLDILDFGCGTGLFGLELLSGARSLTGIDTSEGMLKVFDQKTQNLNNTRSVLLDLSKGDFDGQFDLIVSSMAFHHLDHPEIILKKLSTHLNPNGRIVIVDLDQEDGSFHSKPKEMGVKHFGFSKNDIQDWANEAGLRISNYQFISEIDKNGKIYKVFMVLFEN